LGKVLALMPDKSEGAIKALQAFLTISPQAPEAKAVEAEIGQIEKRMALIHKQGSILRELKLAQLKDGIYVVDLNGSIRFSRNRGQFINGLQRGDKIETVNGRPTKGMSLDEFYSIVENGSSGGHICFVRLRGGADPFELSLKRENLYQVTLPTDAHLRAYIADLQTKNTGVNVGNLYSAYRHVLARDPGLKVHLYGKEVRQPIGGDFGFSGTLASHYLTKPVWDTLVARFGIDIWMTTHAITGGFAVCHARLGAKVHDPKDPGDDLGPMFGQVVGTLLGLTERHAERSPFGRRVRALPPSLCKPCGSLRPIESIRHGRR
jgi:hypothetical protein